MWWWATNLIEFSIVAALLTIVYWFLYINLRKRVAAFLVALLQQEERRKEAAAAAATAASAAAVLSVQASKRAEQEKKELEKDPKRKEPTAEQEQEQAEDVSGSAAAALPSDVPLLSPASPSDAGVVELSECGRGDGGGDGDSSDAAAAATKPKHLLVARTATLTHATSSSSSSSLQLPNSPTPGSPSPSLLLPPEAPLSPGGNTVHIRLVPSKAAARAVKPSLAQVAPVPAPAPRASASASSAAGGAEAGANAASAPTSSSASAAATAGSAGVSQSEARLAELYGALRKLNLLTALVTVLLLGTGCVQIPNLQRYMRGETLSFVVRSPTEDSDGFPFLSGASTCMNQGALMAILYVCTNQTLALHVQRTQGIAPPQWHMRQSHWREQSSHMRFALSALISVGPHCFCCCRCFPFPVGTRTARRACGWARRVVPADCDSGARWCTASTRPRSNDTRPLSTTKRKMNRSRADALPQPL